MLEFEIVATRVSRGELITTLQTHWWVGLLAVLLDKHMLSAGSFAAGRPNATQAKAALRNFANLFGGIRSTRILIYRSHYQVGSQLIYDGTAVANTNYKVGDFAAASPMTTLRDNVEMDLNVLNANLDELWNYYVAYCRNSSQTLSNTICHTSCHGNCHCARGRR